MSTTQRGVPVWPPVYKKVGEPLAGGRAVAKAGSAGRGPATFAERMVVNKAAASFGELMDQAALRTWLPGALEALGQTINASLMTPDDGDAITPADRMAAAIASVDEFRAGLLERVADSIGKRERAGVAKKSSSWGIL